MSTTVNYKGSTLTTLSNQTKTLNTAGKYLEDDIEIISADTTAISTVDTIDSAGGTVKTITALNISDTTATASDVASGKYFYTANGTKTEGSGGSTPYQLGSYYQTSALHIDVINNHVKITAITSTAPGLVGLRFLGVGASYVNSLPTWFTISSGSSVVFKYTNVVNSNNYVWNANLRKANASTSLSYGIGDSAHLSGETITKTASANEDVGCFFVYISSTMAANAVIEFDVEMTIDGVRIF